MGIRLTVINNLLTEQQDLRSVLRFAKKHELGEVDQTTGLYEAQIPLTRPQAGQQYAFSVDLDACTGCKACVAGCNKLNGLDADEAWRSVGLIHGGTPEQPVQRTVTTACHHCLDPACMNGCPVGAYEKDPETGIVRHLDDQCIGCQYCTLTCPYDVPQYNSRLGIVRKCDMCSDRLAEGEAPACVQSCPNGAISIRIVDVQSVLDDAQGDSFLPGAPSPGITAPTTTFRSSKPLPRNALPADFYNVRPASQHMPLVIMLVLTQLAAGAFIVDALLHSSIEGARIVQALSRYHSALALGLGLLALGAATFHLGRPLYAFRAFIGLRKSWMSREIIVVGGFVKFAVLYALLLWMPDFIENQLKLPELTGVPLLTMQRAIGVTTAVLGFVTVICSAMIYVSTKRMFWNATATMVKFFGTAALLGTSTIGSAAFFAGFWKENPELSRMGGSLMPWLIGGTILKLAYEASLFRHLWDKQQGDLKRSAMLMRDLLKTPSQSRFGLGIVGGVILPFAAYSTANGDATSASALVLSLLALISLAAGEFLERTLFFSAMSAPRMPGGVGR
jgi:formate dehydrogenase iron-sulfur subunit